MDNNKKPAAFTLAEVLITLVIIGIVAALTIPTVITNYQKNQYVTQLKKEYNYISNSFKQMMAHDGVTKLSDTNLWSKISGTQLKPEDMLSSEQKGTNEEFLKVFNAAKIYDSSTIPDDYKVVYRGMHCTTSATCASSPITSGVYLNDGAWLNFTFLKTPNTATCGDHNCTSLKEFQEVNNTSTKYWQFLGMINLDVNGPKPPNLWGRDAFKFYFDETGSLYPAYGADMAVCLYCLNSELSSCSYYWKNNLKRGYNCSTTSDSVGNGCAARIMEEGWKMNY